MISIETSTLMNNDKNKKQSKNKSANHLLKDDGMPALEELDFQITNQCPLKCHHCCCSSSPEEGTEWTEKLACDLLNQAVDLGCKEVHLTGGEPLVRSDLFSIIDHAKSVGLYVQLQSSGIILSPKIIGQLQEFELDLFMISLDGLCRNHNYYRGIGSFERTLQSMRLLLDANVPVRVNTIVSRQNMDDLIDLAKLTASLGVAAHSFFYFSPIGRGRKIVNDWLPPTEYRQVIQKLRQYIVANGIADLMAVFVQDGYAESQAGGENPVICRALRKSFLVVLADGRVLPCTWFIDTRRSLGDARSQSLQQIWKAFVTDDTFFAVDPSECSDCSVFSKCRGGCQAVSELYLKKMPQKDPRCDDPLVYYPGCPEGKVRIKGHQKTRQFGRIKELER